jgi:hypothetical protein
MMHANANANADANDDHCGRCGVKAAVSTKHSSHMNVKLMALQGMGERPTTTTATATTTATMVRWAR